MSKPGQAHASEHGKLALTIEQPEQVVQSPEAPKGRGAGPSLGFEAIADAGFGDQVPWMGWFGFELAT